MNQSDIAKLLNVSRTTVARALNGTGSINPDTKEKILKLCEELNYKKNPISTSLALKKEKNIYAFIIKTRNKYYTSELRKGLINSQNELNIYKYKLTIIETHIDSPHEQLQELKRVIMEKKVDGIIITPLLKDEIRNIKNNRPDIAFIALDKSIDNGTISIYSDYYKIGRIVGNMLINSLNDNEKILLIDTDDDRVSSKSCFNGVYDKLMEASKFEIIGPVFQHDLENNIEKVMDSNFNYEIDTVFSSRFLDKIVEYIKEKSYKKLKIVSNGFSENIKLYIKQGIIIATITQNYERMGYMAGKIMFEYLYKGIEPKEKSNEYECKIILKENLDY